jgi:hypothetical protein
VIEAAAFPASQAQLDHAGVQCYSGEHALCLSDASMPSCGVLVWRPPMDFEATSIGSGLAEPGIGRHHVAYNWTCTVGADLVRRCELSWEEL